MQLLPGVNSGRWGAWWVHCGYICTQAARLVVVNSVAVRTARASHRGTARASRDKGRMGDVEKQEN